ncbi:DNA sulfur modification protein DndD [Bacillus safensis]|uniref:DNA sulfur modification protein DndD n=1 Tax=Bacillus safensis TaxID=561879 RepID=UPI002280755C|nr:DNA sulfur modification protein DndD [Bacillus safensis]MCY7673772.1 DNA sulfur modification protein DndD [Bacillus safensis]MCY7696771.1 DNA sulfur modification protein DndD [Bacillus safensis]MEC3626326.1 DNA sulfur modification protein DndD [Bacillus safensis]
MHLNNVLLENIGPYKDRNKFNFETSSDKNVILIGGENGAGKTTLLQAIKLGLFGSYGLGYKTENADYFKHVNSLLNNSAKRNEEKNFSIEIEFIIVDNLKTYEYKLKREWVYSNDILKENDYLVENGSFLDDTKKEVFHAKLKEVMPPKLLEFCLFDGEDIARIISQNQIGEYIKELSKVVFNLDLFENLEMDLDQYSKQELNQMKRASIEDQLYAVNLKEKELRENINSTINSLKEKEQDLKELQDDYLKEKNQFEKHGGLKKKERETILFNISGIEQKRKQRSGEIKQFISTLLPFFLMRDLVIKTREQLKNEESLLLAQQLDKKLDNKQLDAILTSVNVDNSDEQALELKNKLLHLIYPKDQVEMIHGASFSEYMEVERIFNILNQDLLKENLDLLHENSTELKELQKLKEQVYINDSAYEFEDMLQKMEEYNKKIIDLQREIERKNQYLNELKSELAKVLGKIEKIKTELRKYNKTSGSFLEAQKVISLSRRYREIQIKKKLQDIQLLATKNLKTILRKNDYISSIRIDPENYDITLFDNNRNLLAKHTLSAGEKQILVISIIWAIFECSGRQVPFIFDTLLGRLDKTHKASVLSVFIPSLKRQTIILSTDSEIDEYHYQLLSPFISREYTLNFDSSKQLTLISENYFKG